MSGVGDCPKIIKPPHVLSCTHFVSRGQKLSAHYFSFAFCLLFFEIHHCALNLIIKLNS